MPVTVRLFARHAELAGGSDVTVPVELPTTVAVLREALIQACPALPVTSLIAVNLEYATEHHPITVDDEVAIVPPVSGG